MTTTTLTAVPATDMQRELALEEEALHIGIAKFRERNAKLDQKGMTASTDYGARLVSRCVEPMIDAINGFIADAKKKPGKRAAAVKYLELLESDVAAFITTRTIFDGISRIVTAQAVAADIGNALEDEVKFGSFETQAEDLFFRVNENLDKSPWSYNPNRRRSTMNHAAIKFNIVWDKWAKSEKLHLGNALVGLFIEKVGLVEMFEQMNSHKHTVYYLRPTEELSKWITGYKETAELLCPKFMPMVCPPKPWTSPKEGGYYDPRLNHRQYLVKTSNKAYHEELRHREMPQVYAAVNALQETPWKVNNAMLTVLQEIWEAGLEVKGLPSRFDTPLPTKPADIETNKAAKSNWKREAAEVYRKNLRDGSKRMQTGKIKYLAEKFANEAAIYFPIQLDFRGRMYAMPLYLNPQSCDLAKSLLTFSVGKPLGRTGVFWLGVHLANNYGYDKCSLQERHDWAVANSAKIEASANDPIGCRWWMDADKPFQFLAACIEWLGYLTDGGEQYVCSLPIMVDGSCNGLQHFSAMLRDEVCGAKVNLIPSPTPADIYQTVADAVLEALKIESGEGDRVTFAQQWVTYGVNRKLCKRPVMVLPYGGTRESVRKYILEAVMERVTEKNEAHPFGDKLFHAVNYLASVVWEVMKQVVKGPRVAMDWLQQASRVVSKQNLAINWTTPTGFWVRQSYMDSKARRVKTRVGQQTIFMTLREELKDKFDSRKQSQAVSPNFVHSLDASALVMTIVKASGLGLTQFAAIHDSYGTLAADMQALMDALRESFVEMYEQNDVIAEFEAALPVLEAKAKNKYPERPAKGNLDLQGVLKSDFFFA